MATSPLSNATVAVAGCDPAFVKTLEEHGAVSIDFLSLIQIKWLLNL